MFLLPPRSPKLNGHVERAQRTHTEEFYDYYMGELDLKSVNEALVEWEIFYNTVRPHRSLDLRTPLEPVLARVHKQMPLKIGSNSTTVSYVLNEYIT